ERAREGTAARGDERRDRRTAVVEDRGPEAMREGVAEEIPRGERQAVDVVDVGRAGVRDHAAVVGAGNHPGERVGTLARGERVEQREERELALAGDPIVELRER